MSDKDVTFTGRPQEFDHLVADCQFKYLLNPDDFPSDIPRVALFLSRCRGPALTWAARYQESNPNLAGESYRQFLETARQHFGYTTAQSMAIAQTQLSHIRHTGSIIEFFTDFDDACARADVNGDQPKLTLLLSKLKPRYRDAVVLSGSLPTNYTRVRGQLLNMGALELQAADLPSAQRVGKKRSRGKRHASENELSTRTTIKVEPKN